MNRQVMVDLETLGLIPGCKIISIGAVVFCEAGLQDEFYTAIRRDPQRPLREEPEAVAWWVGQPADARAELFGAQACKPFLSEALIAFNFWLLGIAGKREENGRCEIDVWGNGANFDNAVLEVACHEMGVQPMWNFWNNRCFRTLKNLRHVPGGGPFIGTKHNALDDAKHQAQHAVRIMNHLRQWE